MIDLKNAYEIRNVVNNKVIEKIEDELGNVIYEAWKRLLISGIPPLALPKCKGADLVDYKIYGDSKQAILPSEYQQVEYIESTGTQYILTNIKPDQNTGFDIEFLSKTAIGNSSIGCVFGARENSSVNDFQITTYITVNSSYKGTLRCGTGVSIDAGIAYNKKVSCSLRNGIYTDSNGVQTTIEGEFATPVPISLFALNNNGNIIQHGNMQIYRLKLYSSDDLICDFIPCYRKADNTIGMYDLVGNKFYTNAGAETFVKGVDVPTPETPIEIESVGEKSKNLYDAKTYPLTKGYWINGAVNGTSHENLDYASTLNYIPCADLVGKTITISRTGGSNPGVAFYDENKTFISGVRNVASTNTKITATIPEGAVYYRFCVVAEYMDITQVEEGDRVTEYEPYGYKIPVVARGVNLHNHKLFNYKETTTNGITFTPLEDGTFRVKGKLTNTSTTTSYRVVKTTAISVEAGTYRSKPQSSSDIGVMFGVYKKTSNTPFWMNINSTSNGGIVTLDNDAYVGYCQIFVRGGTTKEIDEIVYPQLTKGTTDYPYQPYAEPITTNIYLDEPLRKIGDYADYIDFKNSKVIRKTIRRLPNSTKKNNSPDTSWWQMNVDTEDFVSIYLDISSSGNVPNYQALSNKFAYKHWNNISANDRDNYLWSAGSSSGFLINTSLIEGYDYSWNTTKKKVAVLDWLEANGVDWIHPLRAGKEILEDITLPTIPTHKGTTIIEIDTELLPSNMEVTYLGKK